MCKFTKMCVLISADTGSLSTANAHRQGILILLYIEFEKLELL